MGIRTVAGHAYQADRVMRGVTLRLISCKENPQKPEVYTQHNTQQPAPSRRPPFRLSSALVVLSAVGQRGEDESHVDPLECCLLLHGPQQGARLQHQTELLHMLVDGGAASVLCHLLPFTLVL